MTTVETDESTETSESADPDSRTTALGDDRTEHGTGAWATIRRGLALSPELRVGLGGTLVLALVATAGRLVVPIAVQQVIDRGILSGVEVGVVSEGPIAVDLRFVTWMVGLAVAAVIVTGGVTSWMHMRLARVSESALSTLRIRAFRHIHDLSMLHQASEQRGSLVSRVTSDIDQISRFLQWGGLQLLTIGLVGEYVGKTYLEAKRRPIYLVRDVVKPVSSRNGRRQPTSGALTHAR